MKLTEFAAALARRRATKGAGPITAGNAGTSTLIAGRMFRAMISETIALSAWLKTGMRFVEVAPGTTQVDFHDLTSARWTHVPEVNEGDEDIDTSVEPSYRNIQIACGHFAMELQMSTRAQRRIAAMTGTDMLAALQRDFATALGNNIARTALLGDLSSTDPSLKGCDGIYTRAQAGECRLVDLSQTVGGVQVAPPLDPSTLFFRAMDELPEQYRVGALRWYGATGLWLRWAQWLANSGTDERFRDGVAQDALLDGKVRGPMGYGLLGLPFWPTTDGPSADPTSVVDDMDGTATIRVATVLPDANDYTGRRVRVTLKATGSYEDLVVARSGGQNLVYSAGAFGQVVISANAAHYTVKVIDESSLLLTSPNNLLLAMENQIEVFQDFKIRARRKDIVAHADMDTGIVQGERAVLIKGFHLPRIA